MASVIGICNQALLILGASSITSLDEGSVNSDACNLIYEDTRDSLLRLYPWKFAIQRVQITASSTTPAFGRGNAFPLPDDYLSPLAPYPEDNYEELDWIIEGQSIMTDDSSPLDFRFIGRITDPDEMDPLFRKALSARMAVEMVEALTQSNSKFERTVAIYDQTVTEARKMSAFEAVNHLPPDDAWVSARDNGQNNTRSWHG